MANSCGRAARGDDVGREAICSRDGSILKHFNAGCYPPQILVDGLHGVKYF